jgi:hypothetical protein
MKKTIRFAGIMAACWCWTILPPAFAQTQTADADPWAPIRVFAGKWEGTSTGQAGEGTVTREYEWVMKQRYLHEKNISTYPIQEKNKKGEVHEHWSFFSYDKNRETLVLRQFHVESFVNQYVFNKEASTPAKLVFDSEGFENFSNKWRARDTYDLIGPDEFTETFELAPPYQPFQVYSKNNLIRVAPR